MEQSGLVADEVIGGRIETKSLLGDECTVTAGRVEEESRREESRRVVVVVVVVVESSIFARDLEGFPSD